MWLGLTGVSVAAARIADSPGSGAAVPSVTGVAPNVGPAGGGNVVVIMGAGFTATPTVRFAGVPATSVVVVSSSQLRVVVPATTVVPSDELLVAVTVTTMGGTSQSGSASWYRYAAPPEITSMSSISGTTLGGQRIVLSVDRIYPTAPTTVRFDGAVRTTEYPNPAPGQVAFTTPPHATGPVTVEVEGPGGVSPTASFTYVVAGRPTVTAVTPGQGPVAGGTTITVSGSGFTTATGVRVGGVGFVGGDATDVAVLSDTQLTAVTPPSADTGTVTVYVDTPVASSAPNAAASFTYGRPPTVTSIDPSSGPRSGTTRISISGSGLADATGVRFGPGNPASSFIVESDRRILATTDGAATVLPHGLLVNVVVEHPFGDSATGIPTRFLYSARPTIASLSRRVGPAPGGTTVTIYGSGFLDTTLVQFGAAGAPAGFTVVSDTEIVATTPPSPGPDGVTTLVQVRVTTPVATSAIVPHGTFYFAA